MDVLVTPSILKVNHEIFKYNKPENAYDIYTNGKSILRLVFLMTHVLYIQPTYQRR